VLPLLLMVSEVLLLLLLSQSWLLPPGTSQGTS
jgi:hypothetical protein